MTHNKTNHENVLDKLYKLEGIITYQIRYESYEGTTTRSLCSDCRKGIARRYRCVECLNATLDNIRSVIAAMEATK